MQRFIAAIREGNLREVEEALRVASPSVLTGALIATCIVVYTILSYWV